MRHLTSEELSAHLDRALTGRRAEEVERHLKACEACREALAALASQDAALRPALLHDPGEAYFEGFAAKVERRIASRGPTRAGWGLDLGRLFDSPRSLAWVSAAAVFVLGAGVVLMVRREVVPPDLRDRDLAARAQQVAPGSAREAEAPEASRPRNAPPAPVTRGSSHGFAAPPPGDDAAARSRQERAAAGGSPREEIRLEDFRGDHPSVATPGEPKDKAGGPSTATLGGNRERALLVPRYTQAGTARERRTAASTRAPRAPGPVAPGRAVEVRRNAAGEEVPVRPPIAGPAPARPPVSADELAKVRKKLTAEPLQRDALRATGGASSPEAQKSAAPGETQPTASPAPSSAMPPPAPLASSAPPGSVFRALSAQHSTREAIAAGESRACGVVLDAAARPVAGAQVALADLGRAATTDDGGRFCLEAPAGEHPLSVMAVGFAPKRQTLRFGGEEMAVRVVLDAVPVLDQIRPFLTERAPLPRQPATSPSARADAYAALPDTLRSVVRAAQALEVTATARRSAALFDAAAAGWERALRRLEGRPQEMETRWHLAQARFHAWEAGPNARRASAAIEALTRFAGRAPAGPEREQATRWLDRVRG